MKSPLFNDGLVKSPSFNTKSRIMFIIGTFLVTLSILSLCIRKRSTRYYTDEEIEAGLQNIKDKMGDNPVTDNEQRSPSYLRRDTFLL